MEEPLDRQLVESLIAEQAVDLRTASIREIHRLVNALESRADLRFVRMEFGIPGLPVSDVAVRAEAEALGPRQLGHVYAPFEGIPELKQEIARFAEKFLDVQVPPSCCVPTVGAMQGCFATLLLAPHLREGRRTVLFLQPGFPVNRLQVRALGLGRADIDFYDHRGEKLIRAVERRVRQGDVCAILWSSPNNPSWIVLDETELQGLGRICDRYDIVAIEDLAYFGMDTRRDYFVPGEPPYQPTVLRYARRAVSIISSAKIFSYAGQRVAMMILHPELAQSSSEDLGRYFGTRSVGHALVHGVLYPMTACVPQGPQHGLLALLAAANAGERSLFAPAAEYARRARSLKRVFLEHGFRLVYDNDLGEPLADGFYFTIAYPAFDSGGDLLFELLRYGVSAITLETTGSCRTEGLRACVSRIAESDFELLARRLERFRRDHPAEGPGQPA